MLVLIRGLSASGAELLSGWGSMEITAMPPGSLGAGLMKSLPQATEWHAQCGVAIVATAVGSEGCSSSDEGQRGPEFACHGGP